MVTTPSRSNGTLRIQVNVWSRGSQMDDELKDLFFDAIDHFPLEQRDAAQRWLKKRVVLAKVAEQLMADAGAELPAELN